MNAPSVAAIVIVLLAAAVRMGVVSRVVTLTPIVVMRSPFV